MKDTLALLSVVMATAYCNQTAYRHENYSSKSAHQEPATVVSSVQDINTQIQDDTVPDKIKETNKMSTASTWWRELLDKSQLVMAVLGLMTNIATVVALVQNGKSFSHPILILLRHQSAIDAALCGIATIVLVQPFNWMTGYYVADVIICAAWHGQTFYWTLVCISIWNLVLLAFERFLAVCRPFLHQQKLTKCTLYLMLVAIHIWSTLAECPAYLNTSVINGTCVDVHIFRKQLGNRMYYGHSIVTFTTFYAIPCILFVLFYGLVIQSMYRRRNMSTMGSSQIINKASRELTKTAIIVTLIFLFAIGYGQWYYLLGTLRVVEFTINSPIQKVGIWFSSFNSTANPFVYALVMPAFRTSLTKTFCSCLKSDNIQITSSASEATVVSISTYNINNPECRSTAKE